MDGEDLKILSSPIKRDSSINEDLDRVGFLGKILDNVLDRTRFSSDQLQKNGELQNKTSFIDPSTGVDLLKGCSPDYLLL
jgi:hypothetical protein